MRAADQTGHPIQVVSRRTGLGQDTLRAWERRYGAVEPSRSATGRRLYSDQDVERLLLLRRATLAGRRIGSVARLSVEALREMVLEDEQAEAGRPRPAGGGGALGTAASGEAGPHLEACREAVRRLDAAALDAALSEAAVALSRPALMQDLVTPLVEWVGASWREGSLRIAHEHLATAVLRSFLGGFRESLPPPSRAPGMVVTTPAGQLHELGALLAAAAAASEGWRVTYLGPNLPAEEIAAAARAVDAQVVALGIAYPADEGRTAEEIRELRRYLGPEATILVGGRGASRYAEILAEAGAVRLEGLPAFRRWLESPGR